jgi:hypothetical protein
VVAKGPRRVAKGSREPRVGPREPGEGPREPGNRPRESFKLPKCLRSALRVELHEGGVPGDGGADQLAVGVPELLLGRDGLRYLVSSQGAYWIDQGPGYYDLTGPFGSAFIVRLDEPW